MGLLTPVCVGGYHTNCGEEMVRGAICTKSGGKLRTRTQASWARQSELVCTECSLVNGSVRCALIYDLVWGWSLQLLSGWAERS